jgi:hypothetical protein
MAPFVVIRKIKNLIIHYKNALVPNLMTTLSTCRGVAAKKKDNI